VTQAAGLTLTSARLVLRLLGLPAKAPSGIARGGASRWHNKREHQPPGRADPCLLTAPVEKGQHMKRLHTVPARLIGLVGLVGGLGLGIALVTPPAIAQASTASQICETDGPWCWVNEGPGADVQTAEAGSAWAKADSGTSWDGHEMYYIKTGSGTCLSDAEGDYLWTGDCSTDHPTQLFYWAASGPIVNEETSNQEGAWYCVDREGSSGLLGNAKCPSGTPPAGETWFLT